MNKTLNELQYEIVDWGCQVFQTATPLSCALHLQEEANELVDALDDEEAANDPLWTHEWYEHLGSEIADVMILAIQTAGRLGLNCEQLIESKMEKNRARTWQYDPDLGYSKHV